MASYKKLRLSRVSLIHFWTMYIQNQFNWLLTCENTTDNCTHTSEKMHEGSEIPKRKKNKKTWFHFLLTVNTSNCVVVPLYSVINSCVKFYPITAPRLVLVLLRFFFCTWSKLNKKFSECSDLLTFDSLYTARPSEKIHTTQKHLKKSITTEWTVILLRRQIVNTYSLLPRHCYPKLLLPQYTQKNKKKSYFWQGLNSCDRLHLSFRSLARA